MHQDSHVIGSVAKVEWDFGLCLVQLKVGGGHPCLVDGTDGQMVIPNRHFFRPRNLTCFGIQLYHGIDSTNKGEGTLVIVPVDLGENRFSAIVASQSNDVGSVMEIRGRKNYWFFKGEGKCCSSIPCLIFGDNRQWLISDRQSIRTENRSGIGINSDPYRGFMEAEAALIVVPIDLWNF